MNRFTESMTSKEIDLEIKILKVKIKETEAHIRFAASRTRDDKEYVDPSDLARDVYVIRRYITELETEKYRRALGVD